MIKTGINSFEIARIAGVSRSTVSRVINNYANVPPETREKVNKVIQEYNYYPNHSARALVGQKASTLGLFIFEKDEPVSSSFYYNTFLGSVVEKASSCGYHVLTYIIRDSRDSVSINSVKEVFFQKRVDGGIFIGAYNHEPVVEELIAEGFFIGIVDQELPGRTETNRIICNVENEVCATQVVEYLYQLNHKKIGIINGELRSFSGLSRYQGFLKGMKSKGLEINNSWILQGNFREISGYHATLELLKGTDDLPSAIFTANDELAKGAIRAINEYGKKVPEDISIVGFDDLITSAYLKPALTTVRVDYAKMGSTLIEKLIEIIELGGSEIFQKLQIPAGIVERESCKKI